MIEKMLSYYLPISLISDVYQYMSWDTLYYHNNIPDERWEILCKDHGFINKCSAYTFKDYFLCRTLYQTQGLPYIPLHLWTDDNFIWYSLKKFKSGDILKYLPENKKTKAVILQAIRLTPSALKFVPESMITKDFIMELVNENYWVFKFIPKIMQEDMVIVNIALKYSLDILKFVPQSFIVKNVLWLVNIHPQAITLSVKLYRFIRKDKRIGSRKAFGRSVACCPATPGCPGFIICLVDLL